MKPLVLDEILDLDPYEEVRDEYRRKVIAHKKDRRLAIGDRVGLAFEDRETLHYQIQEMARIERLRDPVRVQHELDTYNELMPGENELSATLFIEIPELGSVRAELDRLIGIDEQVFWILGEGDEQDQTRAIFDPKQMEEERISAVQYIRFPFAPAQVERLARGDRARVQIRHANYTWESEVGPVLRASLLRDLHGQTPHLLDLASPPTSTAGKDEIVYETDEVRVLRPARLLGPEHLVVETTGETGGLLALERERLSELLGVVQRYARQIFDRAGSCRVRVDVDAKGELRARWHLLAPPGDGY